ncbi:hypothetical protein AB0D40_16500 [Streptomyces massasporeus]|uniref:hypothetical protein n=1 Tax=Streptomyces massasporeus TaxID=67324 RepID=UPI0033C5AD93
MGERRALRELAEGGVLLTCRALECGWPARGLTRALRAEGWGRLQAGAWAEPGRDAELPVRLRAVQLLTPRLVVSHRSAAALWRIETLAPATVAPLDFIDPALTFRGKARGVRVRRAHLDPGARRCGTDCGSRARHEPSPTCCVPCRWTTRSWPWSRG